MNDYLKEIENLRIKKLDLDTQILDLKMDFIVDTMRKWLRVNIPKDTFISLEMRMEAFANYLDYEEGNVTLYFKDGQSIDVNKFSLDPSEIDIIFYFLKNYDPIIYSKVILSQPSEFGIGESNKKGIKQYIFENVTMPELEVIKKTFTETWNYEYVR